MEHKYPCSSCYKHCRYTGCNYKICQPFRSWVHEFWSGLDNGMCERRTYKVWLGLMIQRSSWRKEGDE